MAGTRWVRLDVDYFVNPKILDLSPEARALHLASITYAGSQLTDGQIADRSLTYLGQIAGIAPRWARRRGAELTDRGLWIATAEGWTIHDFDAMNPQAMRKIVERDRAAWRERQRRSRDRRHGEVTP